jgi:hypothetical protein
MQKQKNFYLEEGSKKSRGVRDTNYKSFSRRCQLMAHIFVAVRETVGDWVSLDRLRFFCRHHGNINPLKAQISLNEAYPLNLLFLQASLYLFWHWTLLFHHFRLLFSHENDFGLVLFEALRARQEKLWKCTVEIRFSVAIHFHLFNSSQSRENLIILHQIFTLQWMIYSAIFLFGFLHLNYLWIYSDLLKHKSKEGILPELSNR